MGKLASRLLCAAIIVILSTVCFSGLTQSAEKEKKIVNASLCYKQTTDYGSVGLQYYSNTVLPTETTDIDLTWAFWFVVGGEPGTYYYYIQMAMDKVNDAGQTVVTYKLNNGTTMKWLGWTENVPSSYYYYNSSKTGFTSGDYIYITASSTWKNYNNTYSLSAFNVGLKIRDAPPLYTPPTIDLTRPAGGETWTVGDSQNIFWNITDGTADYSVWVNYSADDGDSWYAAHAKITQDSAGAGNFTWTIPNAPSVECIMNITVVDSSMGSDTFETDYFTIVYPAFTTSITNPAGGEEWEAGSVHDINWTATGGIGTLLINISYNIGMGEPFTSIVGDHANDGGYAWTIPNTPSTDVAINITASDENGVTVTNYSELFTIVAVTEPPVTANDITLTVTHPTTSIVGDTITITANVLIDSTTANTISSVAIYYRYQGTTAYTSVAMSLTSGTHEEGVWTGTIPTTTKAGILEFHVKAISKQTDFADTPVYKITITAQPVTTAPATTIFTNEDAWILGAVVVSLVFIWIMWAVKPLVVLTIIGTVLFIAIIFVFGLP